jgi:hypothetical protein
VFGAAAVFGVILNGIMWVQWIHGVTIAEASSEAPVDTWIARVEKVPTDRNPIYMYLALPERHCYRISLYLSSAAGTPPKTSTCVWLGSAELDESKIHLVWLDRDTLQVDLGGIETVEVDVSIYIESTWRRIIQNKPS